MFTQIHIRIEMAVCSTVIIFATFISISQEFDIKHSVCTDKRGQRYCCSNYILREEVCGNCKETTENNSCCVVLRNDDCKPCENGTFGVNCTFRCPRFYYGQFCASKCKCSDDIDCDPRNGKCELFGQRNNIGFPVWTLILSGTVVLVLFVGLLGCCLTCQRRNQASAHKNDPVNDLLEILARRGFTSELDSVDGNENRANTIEYGSSSTNNVSSYHYIDIAMLDINTKAQSCASRQEIEERRREKVQNLSDNNSDSFFTERTERKAWAGSNALPARQDAPPLPRAVSIYHSVENLASGYDTLTRCGPKKTDLPSTSGILKMNLENWNTEKPRGFGSIRKMPDKQKEAAGDNSCKAERRGKSIALSYIRRGIRSVFKGSKDDIEIHSNQKKGSSQGKVLYNVVQLHSENSGEQVRYDNEDYRNVETAKSNYYDDAARNMAGTKTSVGQLPPPPDEWLSENCYPIFSNDSDENSDVEQTYYKFNNTRCPNLAVDKAGCKVVKTCLRQNCHITKGALQSENAMSKRHFFPLNVKLNNVSTVSLCALAI